MDFIIMCDECEDSIPVNPFTYLDTEMRFDLDGTFHINGLLECVRCGRTRVLDIVLEPVEYELREME